MAAGQISQRAAAVAVVTALLVGVLASLAIRPPGGTASRAAATSEGEAAVRVRWRVPEAFASTMPVLGENAPWVAGQIRAASGGAVDLQISEPGEIVPAFSIIDAVRERKVEAGYTWIGYDQGKVPASTLLAAVPFGMEPWEFSAWWFEGGGRELGQALYARHNVHILFCGLSGPETAGWFRQRVTDLRDIRGLKIRFAGLGGKVLERAGASVTMIPGGEIFQALEKGAIDATEFAQPVVDQALGFSRVAPYNYYPGWHQPFSSSHLVVNRDAWDSLRPADQALLETACTAGVTRNLAASEGRQGDVIRAFADEGVSAETLPRPVLDALAEVAGQVLEEEAAQDPDFAEILASQRSFRAMYAEWRERAYLPLAY